MKLITRANIDRFLFLYGAVISFALFFGALSNLEDTANLTTFVLFLPVSLYFLGETARVAYRYGHHFLNWGQPKTNRYFQNFTLPTFLDQSEVTFLITLLLLALALSLSLFRLSLAKLQ